MYNNVNVCNIKNNNINDKVKYQRIIFTRFEQGQRNFSGIILYCV